jgi:VanZ family protein
MQCDRLTKDRLDEAAPLQRRAFTLARRMARPLFFVSVAGIAALSLVPGDQRPHSGFPGGAEHFAAYAGAGFLLAFAYVRRRDRLCGLLGLAIAAGCFELLQHFSPGRHPSVSDALASSSGAAFGAATGALSVAFVAAKLA